MSVKRTLPVLCSKCQSLNGWPFRARSESEKIVVDMRCRDCGEEWTDDMPGPRKYVSPERLPLIERRRTTRRAALYGI
jgi:hypothetical protein